MYGYVTPNSPELKVREQDEVNAWYCGLCSCLKENFGRAGQLTLNHDMNFLILLLGGLYEPEKHRSVGRCIVHPLTKRVFLTSKISGYAADMNILLGWYKVADDGKDEKKLKARTMMTGLRGSAKKVMQKYPEKAKAVSRAFKILSRFEQEGSADLDKVSGQFGKVMSEVCDIYGDEWSSQLRGIGFSLGRFIYIMDAYEDMKEDEEKGIYNCLSKHLKNFDTKENFDEFVYNVLNNIMAECAKNFELLPITENIEIIRNIIYAGVWRRWEELHNVKCSK